MRISYLDDLIIKNIFNSWFIISSETLGRSYLYNNESCELGILPDISGTKLEVIIKNIIRTKTITTKPTSSPQKYIERKETPRLMLFLTASCNLRCIYCHCNSGTGENHMSDEYALNVVKRYLDHVRAFTGNISNIEITFMGGGEPFLRINTIKKIVSYIEENGIIGKYVIVTNATLGNNSDWDWIASKNFRVTISADGPPILQDKQRIFARSSRGTSTYVAKRLHYLSDIGVDVNIRSTVMEVSSEYIDLICGYFTEFACVKTHHLEPVSFAGRGENCRDISENEFYYLFFKSYSKYLFLNPIRFKSAWFKPFKKSHGFCGAVYFNAVVTHDGFVSLCSEVDSSSLSTDYGKKYIVSHIKDESPFLTSKSISFSENHSIDNISECQKCIIRYKCGGGCYIKRDRDFEHTTQFINSFCQNSVILNMSYLIGNLNHANK